MPQKKCDKNCLECKLPKCIHDIEDERKAIDEKFKQRQKEIDKIRHAKYYLEHKAEIDVKQKEYNRIHRRAETIHAFYMAHKEEINEKNRQRYANNREKRKAESLAYYYEHKEEIAKRRKERRLAKKNAVQSIKQDLCSKPNQ